MRGLATACRDAVAHRPPPRRCRCSSTPLTIFVSAFLLFLVQPVMAKQILPWFGGSAAVWTTCLVFFQTALLARLRLLRPRRAPARAARAGHAARGAARACRSPCCRSFPARTGSRWAPRIPSWLILGLLAATIGLPYFLLSTTSPLVQAWFARARPGAQPLSAVRAVEPRVDAGARRLSVPARAVGRRRARRRSAGPPATRCSSLLCAAALDSLQRCAAARAGGTPASRAGERRHRRTASRRRRQRARLLWCALAATGSLLLLAVIESHHAEHRVGAAAVDRAARDLSADVHPLLRRHAAGIGATSSWPMLAAALGVMAWTLADPQLTHELALQIGVFCVGPLHRVHVLPRRARAAQARADVPHAVLPDGLARAAPAARCWSASSRRSCCRRTSSSPVGLVALRAAAALAGAARASVVFIALAVAAVLSRRSAAAIWGIVEFYDGDDRRRRATSTACCACRNAAPTTANHRRSLIHGTILHGTQYLGARAPRGRPTTLLHARPRASAALLESLHPRHGAAARSA